MVRTDSFPGHVSKFRESWSLNNYVKRITVSYKGPQIDSPLGSYYQWPWKVKRSFSFSGESVTFLCPVVYPEAIQSGKRSNTKFGKRALGQFICWSIMSDDNTHIHPRPVWHDRGDADQGEHYFDWLIRAAQICESLIRGLIFRHYYVYCCIW